MSLEAGYAIDLNVVIEALDNDGGYLISAYGHVDSTDVIRSEVEVSYATEAGLIARVRQEATDVLISCLNYSGS